MLDTLVVVDYIDGAGGEYLSNIINSHSEFGCAENPLAHNMQQVSDVTQKWLNSRHRIIKNWDDEFKNECESFISQCRQSKIKNIAIPYHLYYYPAHINSLTPLATTTRFVKINSTKHANVATMDFVRKILFRQLSVRDIYELSYRLKTHDKEKVKPLMDLFQQHRLFGIDLVLFAHDQPVTRKNRSDMLNYLMSKEHICPSTDIEIDYGDFFISLDNLKKSYYTLCNSLNIVPSEAIAEEMLIRNKRNLEEVTEFSKNFDSIKNTILSTTL